MSFNTRKPAIFLMLIAALALYGCASQDKDPDPQGYLATHIFEDGSKQFVYTVDLPESGRGRRGGGRSGGRVQGSSSGGLSGGVSAGSGGRKSGGRSGGRQGGKGAMLVEALDNELKATGFCRDGYMELDRTMESGQTSIKGECTESATEADRKNFPNAPE